MLRDILQNQLEIERQSAEKKLTPDNLDTMYKITALLCNLDRLERPEPDIAQYSNGKYDKNIDALYEAYMCAKEAYHRQGDDLHREKVMECLRRLIVEVYDLLAELIENCDFRTEKEELNKYVRMLADM